MFKATFSSHRLAYRIHFIQCHQAYKSNSCFANVQSLLLEIKSLRYQIKHLVLI